MARLGYVPTPDPYRTGLRPLDMPPRPLWHWPLAVAGCLALVYGLFVVLFWSEADRMVYMTRAVIPRETPVEGTAKVVVTTEDGERLWGYWRPPAPGRPVVVTFHGYESPRVAAKRFSYGPWQGEGWGVLALAFRGYPGSTGKPTEEGLQRDAEAALAFVAAQSPDARVVLHGHGIGAAVAVRAADEHEVAGLYVESPFTSLRDFGRALVPFMPSLIFAGGYDSLRRMPFVRCRTLVVHWDEDRTVPVEQGRRLADAARYATFVVARGDGGTLWESPHDALATAMFSRASVPRPGL